MPFEEAVVCQLFHQMLLAANHLHEHKIVHRDLKLKNFLLGRELTDLKLIDFGMAIDLKGMNEGGEIDR